MELSKSSTTTETAARAQAMRSTSNIAIVVSFFALALETFFLITTGHWQFQVIMGYTFLFAIVNLLIQQLVRRDHVESAAWLFFGSFFVLFPATTLLIAGLNAPMAISVLLLNATIAPRILPAKQVNRVLIISTVVSMGTMFLLLVDMPIQLVLPGFRNGLFVILGIAILIFGYTAVRNFNNYLMRSKLIIITVANVAFAIGAIAGITYFSWQNALVPQIEASFRNQAENIALFTGNYLSRHIAQTAALTVEEDILNALTTRNESYTGGEADVLSQIQAFDVQRLTADERGLLVTQISDNNTAVHSVANYLIDYIELFPQYSALSITDRYGAIVAAAGHFSDDYDTYRANESWWQAAWNDGAGNIYLSDPFFDENSSAASIIIAVPVRAEDEVIGIISATLRLNELYAAIDAATFGKTGRVMLFNRDAELLYEPTSFAENESGAELPAELRQGFLEEGFHFEVAKDANGDESAFAIMPLILASADRVDQSELPQAIRGTISGQEWLIVVQQEASEAFALIDQFGLIAQLLGAFALLAASVGAVIAARRIAQPLAALSETAQSISDGNLEVTFPPAPEDEIGVLSRGFAAMVTQLRNLIGSLEQRVADRTRDLNLAAEIGQQVSLLQQLDELLAQAVQLVQERFGLYQTQIYLVDETGERLVLEASAGHAGTQLLEAGHALPIDGNSLNGTAVLTKQAAIVSNTAENPAFRPHPLLPATRSEMVVPLVVGEKAVGVLDLQSDTPNALVEENLPAFETLAGQLAVAIQNAALLTERQQAEMRIRANESLMRTIIDSTPDWIFVKDTDHRYILANKGYADSLHINPDDFIGKNDLDLGFPEEIVKGDPEKGIRGFWADDREIMERGEVKIIDEEPAVIDDEERFLNTIKAPLKDSDDTVTGIVGFVHDITDRKRFEKELEEAHARAQEILESITVPIVISRIMDGIVAYVNEPLAEVIRIPRDELIGQVTPDFYGDPADRQKYLTALREQGKVYNYDLRLKRGDGELFWALLSGRVIDFEGAPAIITSVTDITERREAQVALARRAVELEAVADVSTVATTVLEPEELVQQVVDLTKERFNLYHAHLYLLNESKKDLVLTNGAGEIGAKMVAEGRRIALSQEQSLVARAARSQAGVVVNNVQEEPGFLPYPLLPDTRAEMAVPLVIGNEVLGVLDVQANEVDHFTPEDINIFTTLASQVAVALQNARRHNEALRALDELTRLQRIMVHEGWEDYLKVQERPFFGYTFNPKGAQTIEGTNTAVVVTEETSNGSAGAAMETAVPIAVRGELVGKIALRSPDGRAIPERKQSLIQTVAHQVSEALERARLTAQTQQALAETAEQARRRAVLNQISEQINRAETMDDIFAIVADGTNQILPSDRVSLAILDDAGEYYSIVSLIGDEENVPVHVDQVLAGSLIEKAIKTGEILVTQDDLPHTQTGICSSLIVPLLTGSGIIGTLNVGSKEQYVYTEGDRGMMLRIASLLSSVIENKRLLTETQERARELAFINQVVAAVSSSLDIQKSLQTVAEQLSQAINVQEVAIALLNDDLKGLTVIAETYNPENAGSSMGYVIPIEGNALTQELLNKRKTVFVEDAQNSPLTEPVHEGMRMRGVQSLYLIPMFAGNEIVGTVGIDLLEEGRRLTPEQLSLAETIVFQAATAVQNTRLYTQSEQHAKELAFINRIINEINSVQDVETGLQFLATELGEALQVPSVTIGLVDDTGTMLKLVASHSPAGQPSPVGSTLAVAEDPIILQAMQTRQTVVVDDVANSSLPPHVQELLRKTGVRSMYVIPMILGRDLIGTVTISLLEDSNTITPDQLRMAETTMFQVATAVQNARLFSQSEERAKELALINRVVTHMSTLQDVNSGLQFLVEELRGATQADSTIVGLINSTATIQEVVAASLPEGAPNPVGTRIPTEGDPLMARALQTLETLVIEDVSQSPFPPEVQAVIHESGYRSLYIIPMITGRSLIGTATIGIFQDGKSLSPAQLRLAETLVFQATSVVQSIRLYAQTEERAAELSLINTVSELASSQSDLPNLFESVGSLLRDTFNAQSLYFALYHKGTETISIPYFFSNEEGRLNIPSRPLSDGGYAGQVIAARESILRLLDPVNPTQQAQAEGAVVVSSRQTDCYLGTPMIVADEVIGVIALNSLQTERPYDEQDQRLLETLADTIGVAVQNIQQFQMARRRAEREVLINSINQKIQSASSVQSALETAVSELGQALKLKKAVVELALSKQENGHQQEIPSRPAEPA